VWARTLLWKLCNASCWDGCRVSGVSWYDHDGDAYFSLETVLLIRDSVNFATNVDCLCALFHTFAMRIFFIAFDLFSSIINIQKSPLFTFFDLTCPKNIAFRFRVIGYMWAFYYQSLRNVHTRNVHSRDFSAPLEIYGSEQPWSQPIGQCLGCRAPVGLSDAAYVCWWTQKATGWCLEQNIVDTAVNEWRMHTHFCVHTNGQYVTGILNIKLLSAVAQQDNWINCQPKC